MQIDSSTNARLYLQFLIKNKALFNYERGLNFWSNIPIQSTEINQLYKYYFKGAKFLDLGCGIGNVLFYAQNIGYDVTGVEFNADYEIYLKPYKYIIQDIRNIQPNFLKQFDVIYTYKPLKDDFSKFVDFLNCHKKKEAILITPFYGQ